MLRVAINLMTLFDRDALWRQAWIAPSPQANAASRTASE